ncbi:hypothetical protein LOZ12_004221 [Ophidiomyces ophidiicola]|uniref:uncharacterized protein n=1 Tax=Ophidiomyces ophidiicola TaxID=1387563 RepID=UPI0020C2EBE3|nr:uncharacterized protein LOZ57_000540 [Ophidiomyces ophidiicola]KAI1919224.1 hypothetical protein LOZ64_002344 [Ophidiomyces ophidiicola]KAI1944390.1 hypothetical protein LOZ62_004189 [Ophidiomyces ophidiicola]KAI1954190.1 hypothetical protein LOZ57_000540 [Ophidiomyces ophidiicola]KAI1960032.1 hypothetical protein LOZ59_002847 [Ophidiomyces ophidiicola]KAI1971091.1 hypothetical protein LOZ56_003288 [Ophidiomyces ophidiicola]
METLRKPSPASLSDRVSGRDVPGTVQIQSSARHSPVECLSKQSNINGANATKPKQSKSRNGCATCKLKRLKCDETKPICQQCQRRNVTCGGYKKDYKWRSFEESSFTNKAAKGKKVPIVAPPVTEKKDFFPISASSSPENSAWTTELKKARARIPVPKPTGPKSLEIISQSPANFIPPFVNPHEILADKYDGNSFSAPPNVAVNSSESKDNALFDTYTSFAHDNLTDRQPNFSAYTKSNDSEIEEIVQQTGFGYDGMGWVDSVLPHINSRPQLGLTMAQEPTLSPGSSEMLLMSFDRRTCGILSVKDGVSENPWRTLIWPLAKESPALYHAICCLAAFHSSKEDAQLRYTGMDHMRQSIQSLARNIRTMRTDAALATTLALTFAESWDRQVSNGIQHLRGAKILVNQALEDQRHVSIRRSDFARLRFLYNAWIYTTVLARLTSLNDSGFDEIPWPRELSPTAWVHEIDPLLGCAATLFPLINKVAHLVQKVCKSRTNSIAIISEAIELKTLVEQWEPPTYFEPPEDPTSDVQHSFQTAQAYRWATLLHLHRAVPEIPSESASELAKRVLVQLATVPLSSRTIVIQIYPLLTASCEVDSEEDRMWVRERWAAMQARLKIGNIDRCLEVIYEVWSRRDDCYLAALNGQRFSFVRPVDPTRNENIQGDAIEDGLEGLGFFDPQTRPESVVEAPSIAFGSPPASLASPVRGRRESASVSMNSDFEKTVRGRTHWLGVMRDWDWEVLLG